MRIPRHLQFTRIEAVLSELEGAGSYVLTTPIENSYHALGGEAALAQAYVTWAQQESRPHIRYATIDAPAPDEAVSRFASLSAALLASRISFGESDLTERVRARALDRVDALQSERGRSETRGLQLEVFCADHHGRSHPAKLYDFPPDEKPTPKPESSLGDLVGEILQATMPLEHGRGETKHLVEPLAGAIYELFRNTHEHARHDLAGNVLKRSIRAIHARRHPIDPGALARVAADTPAIATYCRRLRPTRGRAQLQLLEVSVMDSGPGLAARWLGRSLGPQDRGAVERGAVMECFESGASTKPRPGAGMGLSNLIAVGRASNGFLRLRTGAQSLCADLGLEAAEAFATVPRLAPLHGERRIARVSGTLWTLLLPIDELV
ncbi:hypothetical protein [Sphingomonas sp. BAUL-RG-20F-R05-02]|uniref:hypothetical protein n=1 Tax=Sphingomonas sp. BAUL-RG-20F-R05-02 TaxID=2914830 RepID=UPI001F5828C8|nr:hypothetical protein [Sphingomonas sp. BAUL-RG-20F-R05-02]